VDAPNLTEQRVGHVEPAVVVGDAVRRRALRRPRDERDGARGRHLPHAELRRVARVDRGVEVALMVEREARRDFGSEKLFTDR